MPTRLRDLPIITGGSIALSTGSKIVTGTAVAWALVNGDLTENLVGAGARLVIEDTGIAVSLDVDAMTDVDELTLALPWTGAPYSGTGYRIYLPTLSATPQIKAMLDTLLRRIDARLPFDTKADAVGSTAIGAATVINVSGYRFVYSASAVSHLLGLQNAPSGRWFVYDEPMVWQSVIDDTQFFTGTEATRITNAIIAARAINRGIELLSADGTLTIDPVAAAADTDEARLEYVQAAMDWVGKCRTGNNVALEIFFNTVGAIPAFGQLMANNYGATGFSHLNIRLRMGTPASRNVESVQYNKKISGTSVVDAPRYGGVTHVSVTSGGAGLTNGVFDIQVHPDYSETALTGFHADVYVAGGTITGAVVDPAERGTGGVAGDIVTLDWSPAGLVFPTLTVNMSGDSVASVTVVDGGGPFVPGALINPGDPMDLRRFGPNITFRGFQGSGGTAQTEILDGETTINAVINVIGGAGYQAPALPILSGAGVPLVTVQVNGGITPTVITLKSGAGQSAFPTNAELGMPIGIAGVRGDGGNTDGGGVNGGHIITGIDSTNYRIGIDATFIVGAMVDPAAISAGTVQFPPTWFRVRGGFTGGAIEGFINTAHGCELQVRDLHGVWDPSRTTQQGKHLQKFIASGQVGGRVNVQGGIAAGFPGGILRLVQFGPSFVSGPRYGVSPYGDDIVTLQNGGTVQISGVFGGARTYGLLVGQGTYAQTGGSDFAGCNVAIQYEGGDGNFEQTRIFSSTIGVQSRDLGRGVGGATALIDRCTTPISRPAGGDLMMSEVCISNPRSPVTMRPSEYSNGGKWVSDVVAGKMLEQWITSGGAHVGAQPGWVVRPASDSGIMATLAAGFTNATLVVPVYAIKTGDTLIGFQLIGQIESAGNNVQIGAVMYRYNALAGDPAVIVAGTLSPISVNTDTKLHAATASVTGMTEVIHEDDTCYMLITATTGAATDIQLMGVAVQISR